MATNDTMTERDRSHVIRLTFANGRYAGEYNCLTGRLRLYWEGRHKEYPLAKMVKEFERGNPEAIKARKQD